MRTSWGWCMRPATPQDDQGDDACQKGGKENIAHQLTTGPCGECRAGRFGRCSGPARLVEFLQAAVSPDLIGFAGAVVCHELAGDRVELECLLRDRYAHLQIGHFGPCTLDELVARPCL